MQLYHLLMQWIDQKAAENDKGFFKRMKRKGCHSYLFVVRKTDDPLMMKWEQAFIEAQKDGLPILHYRNPITGENDLTMIVFDNRLLNIQSERANTLSGKTYEDMKTETELQ